MTEASDINAQIHIENAGSVRAFLTHTRLMPGNCFCDREGIESGRELINGFAAELAQGEDGELLTLEQTGDVLEFLAVVTARPKQECFGCGMESATCGYGLVLHWLCDSVRAAHAVEA